MKQDDNFYFNKKTIKSDKVYDYGTCWVFQPINPVVDGHLLVVNKIPTKDFSEDENIFAETSKIASRIISKTEGDFNLITSKGRAATQTVFHTHIHLVPRKIGDGLKLPWSNQHNKKHMRQQAIDCIELLKGFSKMTNEQKAIEELAGYVLELTA